MTVKIKHNKAHVLYKALGYDHWRSQNLQATWALYCFVLFSQNNGKQEKDENVPIMCVNVFRENLS